MAPTILTPMDHSPQPWTMSTSSPTTTDPQNDRSDAEKKLAQDYLAILQGHHKTLARADELSWDERRILSRTTYQNWTVGLALGALTLGTLVGVSLRRQATTTAARIMARRSPSAYQNLDAAVTRGKQRGPPVPVLEAPPRVDPRRPDQGGDVMTQVQLLVYGATAIVVTVASSWYFARRDDFYRAVGRLPLLPGRSALADTACPDLAQLYRRQLAEAQEFNSNTSSNTFSVLQNPQTVELQSAFQLVFNCEQRYQLLRDQQQATQEASGTSVPRPGVPWNYLGIPADYYHRREGTSSSSEDELVNEYDWLQKLVGGSDASS